MQTMNLKGKMMAKISTTVHKIKYRPIATIALALPLALAVLTTGVPSTYAKITKCKIKVVKGTYKGNSINVTMKDGSLVGQSGMTASNLNNCQAKKYYYGRWYHLCKGGTLIVYKNKDNRWKKLKPKSLLKYKHNCF